MGLFLLLPRRELKITPTAILDQAGLSVEERNGEVEVIDAI